MLGAPTLGSTSKQKPCDGPPQKSQSNIKDVGESDRDDQAKGKVAV
jgi:hypothetical protein